MPRPLFRLSDPHSIQQYHEVRKVLAEFGGDVVVVYQSNWYIVMACLDEYVARTVRGKLSRIKRWDIEIRPGRKNKDRYYLRLKFIREK